MKKQSLLAEFIGTFALVFFGTASVIVEELHPSALTPVGIALVFGGVVMVMIYIFGETSGAHFNPAVSWGFVLSGSLEFRKFCAYIMAQFVGGVAASLLLRGFFPHSVWLGGTLFSLEIWMAFLLEVVLTFFLMLVILRVSSGANNSKLLAGFAIGTTISMAALAAGPLTGASMNPVRSLAPALVANKLAGQWIYLTAPFIGASLAVLVDRIFKAGPQTGQ